MHDHKSQKKMLRVLIGKSKKEKEGPFATKQQDFNRWLSIEIGERGKFDKQEKIKRPKSLNWISAKEVHGYQWN